MARVRQAAVAGSWYPDSTRALETAVDGYLAAVHTSVSSLADIVGLISPHAGLVYSGPVAACAYRELEGRAFDVAVIVGPSHFEAFEGVAVSLDTGFAGPLGVAAVEQDCASSLLSATPVVVEHARAHQREHAIEMQLPFLQRVLPGLPIVPLVMGFQTRSTVDALAAALGSVLVGRRALLIASTDLSHYHDAAAAARLDSIVIDCVTRFDADGLQRSLEICPEHACGGGPAVAVMRAARLLGAREAVSLRYADSGDVSGDKSAVVGYLAAAIGRRRGE